MNWPKPNGWPGSGRRRGSEMEGAASYMELSMPPAIGAFPAATEVSRTYTEQDNHSYSYEQNNKGER